MSNPPELWAFIIANIIGAGLAFLMTLLSFLAYRATNRSQSFRSATIGFGLLTLGTMVEPMYQLILRGDYNLSGRELLGLQSVEAVLLGLGFGVLFYSIYVHSSQDTDLSYGIGHSEESEVAREDSLSGDQY
ncbi:MAG: hypothetical protein ABEH64_07320 [Salinirussus sp.]